MSWTVALRLRELFLQLRCRKKFHRSFQEIKRSNLGLAAEVLEDRTLLATFLINDDGGGDFTSIQAAIDAAATRNGDILQISGGADRIHTEQGVFVNKFLTIQGVAGATQVIVQAHTQPGVATDRVFDITLGTTGGIITIPPVPMVTTIDNLTIRHGNFDRGRRGDPKQGNSGNHQLHDYWKFRDVRWRRRNF